MVKLLLFTFLDVFQNLGIRIFLGMIFYAGDNTGVCLCFVRSYLSMRALYVGLLAIRDNFRDNSSMLIYNVPNAPRSFLKVGLCSCHLFDWLVGWLVVLLT